MHKIAFLLATVTIGVSPLAGLAADPKVYALFAFDTDLVGYDNDGGVDANATRVLRSGAKKNRDMVMAAFVESFNQEGRRHRLEYKILEGKTVTWQKILAYWETIDSTEQDTFVFYYFGHGAVDSHLGHYFALTHGSPCYRSYVRSHMQSRPNRLCVLLTDCCSSKVDADNGFSRVAEGANWEVMNRLMFGPSGLVDVTAAKPGTEAQASAGGGFFTESLVHYFCGPTKDAGIDGKLSWATFLASTYARVKAVHKMPQELHIFYLEKWGTIQRERTLVVHNSTEHAADVYVQYHAFHSGNKSWDWHGSSFLATDLPAAGSKSWTVAKNSQTRLGDGENYSIRGDTCRLYIKSRVENLQWARKDKSLVYGTKGYISDEGGVEEVLYTFK